MPSKVLILFLLIAGVAAPIPYVNTPDIWRDTPEVLERLGDDYQIINKTEHVQRNSTVTVECKAPLDAPEYWHDTLFLWKVHTADGFKEIRPCIEGNNASIPCPNSSFNKSVFLRARIDQNELIECVIRVRKCELRDKKGENVIMQSANGNHQHYINKERICRLERLYKHRITFNIYDPE